MFRFLSKGMGLFRRKGFLQIRFLPRSVFIVLFLVVAFPIAKSNPLPEIAKVFPPNLGQFHQIHPARQMFPGEGVLTNDEAPINNPSQLLKFEAAADYASAEGEKLNVLVLKFENDSAAYARFVGNLRYLRNRGQTPSSEMDRVGTASFISSQGLSFFKGSILVTVGTENGKNTDRATELGRLFAATLDKGEGDIPVLVKHLPNWEAAQKDLVYAISAQALLEAIPNQPILKELTFDGGTEAVSSSYGASQLVIVEFTTPQFSVDNDQRILAKIQELRSQDQPVPTAYRRVGNYSVFVFNAPDEKAADALIDSVKYEQVVQWLGEDPHLEARIERYLAQTTAGVLIAVLKSSGLSLLICLAAGTLFGALLFRHRRAQHAALYSDAGGGTRLNLDELTGTKNSHRLLETGKQSDSDS